MKKIFEKYPILRYVISSYVKFFLYSFAFFVVIFAVLGFTGLYARLASALDLKYNSPFILVPLYGFAALSLLCFVIGVLMYFHKYKRSKNKNLFYKTFSNILGEKQKRMEKLK